MAVPGPTAWLHALVSNVDTQSTLEAVAEYALGSREQHADTLDCTGLVDAIVQCMHADELHADARQPGSSTPAKAPAADLLWQPCCEAALEAALALTISSRGLQALLKAGALSAACSIVCMCCQPDDVHAPAQKRPKTAAAHHASAEEGQPPALLALALQLLVALLLEPCADRPAAGSLSPCVAADTACALLQASAEPVWKLLPAKQQLEATAVLMRLAMEPGVVEQLCDSCVSADCLSSTTHAATASTISINTAAVHTDASPSGLASLLGPHSIGVEQFLATTFEQQPLLCAASGERAESPTSGAACSFALMQQQQPRQQQTHVGRCPGPVSAAAWLAQELTPVCVLEQVLRGLHCPVLDNAMTDPVQVLHKLHSQGQLLRPLLLNQDVRIIRATAATPTAVGAAAAAATTDAAPAAGAASGAPAFAHAAAAVEDVLELEGPLSVGSLRAALETGGYTVVLRDMPKRCWAAALLVEALEAQLGLPAGSNLYLTPSGAQGLRAHYDDHDVFVLQLLGSKAWVLGPPQHGLLPLTHQPRLPVQDPLAATGRARMQQQPWPQQAAMPAKAGQASATLRSQQEQDQDQAQCASKTAQQGGPVQKVSQGSSWPQHVVLMPGDCLYIPRGFVHQAVALPTPSSAATAAAAVGLEHAPDSTHGDSSGTPFVGSLPPHPATSDTAADTGACGACSSSAACRNKSLCGSSLHLSAGLEVAASDSVQGFLHHLIETCTGRVCAEACPCCQAAGEHVMLQSCHSKQLPAEKQQGQQQEQQQQPQWSVGAAGLLLHMRLWQQAQVQPAYRRACPLLASDAAAEVLSASLLQQLLEGHAACSTAQESGSNHPNQQQQTRQRQQPAWLAFAVQQLMPPWLGTPQQRQQQQWGEEAGFVPPAQDGAALVGLLQDSRSLLDLLLQELLPAGSAVRGSMTGQFESPAAGATASSHKAAAAGTGPQHPNPHYAADTQSLLGLPEWLEAAACSPCGTCSSSWCHSAHLCAAAALQAACVAGTGGGRMAGPVQQHLQTCRCCSRLFMGTTLCGAQLEAEAIASSLALLMTSMTCSVCQAVAVDEYRSAAKARLAASQAVRRAFVAASMLG